MRRHRLATHRRGSLPMVEDRPRRPQRVRVSSPRTSASAARPRGGAQEIDAQTHLGGVYMRSLLRTQLRLALTALALVVGPLAALPVDIRAGA